MIPGSFLKVWQGENWVLAIPEEEPRIDAAVSQWIDSGGTRDTILRLTLVDGDTFTLRASTIDSWLLSTPEGRRRSHEWDKAAEDERREQRTAAGFPWDEDD